MSSKYLMALDAGGGGGHCLLAEIETGRSTRAFRPWTCPSAPNTAGLGTDLDLDIVWSCLSDAAVETLQRAGAASDEVLGIAVTSMRHTTVLIDGEGKALLSTPNRDSRGVTEAFQLATDLGDEIYARSGHWPSPLSTAARLRWLASSAPEVIGRAARVLSLNEWIAYRLCGEIASDLSQAGETLLLDLEKRDWAWDLIEKLALPRALFPPLRPSGERLGSLTDAAATMLGLRPGIAVAVGGGDTQCGLLGAGAVAAGQAAAILGTTAPLQLVLDRPLVDPKQRLWTGCHVVPGLWVIESNAGAMGEAAEWFANVLYPDAPDPVAMLFAEASLSVPGAAGIISTFGADIMNARALRLPVGTLSLSHLSTAHDPRRRRHLVRAIVEGMAYALRANLEQIAEVTAADVEKLRLGGGMSRSEVFAQITSDVLARPVTVGATREATALGAAICAGVGGGAFGDLAEGSRRLGRDSRELQPHPERAHSYRDFYAGWQRLRTAEQEPTAIAEQLILPSVLQAFGEASTSAQKPSFHPRILVTADLDEEALAALRSLGDVEYASFRQKMQLLAGPSLVKALEGVHVFITEIDVVDTHAIEKCPELRVVAACRGDAVNVDVAACSAFGIPVLNAPGRNADAVADLTVAFLLMLARKLPEASKFLHQPDIEPGDIGRMGQAFGSLQGRELWHKTVGLLGLGAVGRGVAKRLAGFGARVLVYDPYIHPEHAVLAGAEPLPLDELLERSDFVSLHAPVTDQTAGMIGAAQLARMRPGSFLINTARAALVNEDALAEALRSGHLGGAALDVFSVEPPGSDHPLLAFENVIATPHVGGNTVDVASHQGHTVAEDLRRLLSGQSPLHALNPDIASRFDWNEPRPKPDAEALEEIASHKGPAVSDLQRDRAAAKKPSPVQPADAGAPPPPAPPAAPPELAERMKRILRGFVDRIDRDPSVQSAAAGKDVTLHFTLSDLDLEFYLRMRGGKATADLGKPEPAADVELKMRAEILDGMFTGSVNAMQAATSGKLSFSGDTVKAMALQDIQGDMSRLYNEARTEVGGPGDLSAVPAAGSGGGAARAASPLTPGDVREELIQIVNELYATQLITATGGNVSVRATGNDNEIWITPSQLFKGDLRPEILVRLDLDGNSLDPNAMSPSSERLMHCAVYRARPEAHAVVHAHAPNATILANTGLPFLPISTEAAFFGEIPRVPFIMPGTEELADAVAEAMRHSWAVLMQNHGLLVAGRSLRRAADMVEIIERSAEVILGCFAVGKEPSKLPDSIIRTLQKMGDLVA